MNFRISVFVPVFLLSVFFAACSSTPKVETPAFGIDAANAQLAKVPILGFPGFSSKMPMNQFDQYGANSATVAKGVVEALPPGYKLQIAGHANSGSGKPESFLKSISTDRAKFVHDYFAKKGLPPTKMTYVGVGDTDQDSSLSKLENRRVTFKLVESK